MPVTPANIATALGRADSPTATETAQWQMWIDDAEMLLEVRADYLNITFPGTIDQARIDYVVREAVVAHVRRPDDATQVTVNVTDASTSRTYRSGRGRITIIDEWWSMLGLELANGGAFSVDTAGASSVHAAMCAINFGATYCSCGADLTNYAYPLFDGNSADPIFPFTLDGP